MKDFCHRKIALAPSNPCWALAFLGPEQGAVLFYGSPKRSKRFVLYEKPRKKQIPRRMAPRNDTAVVNGEWNDRGYSAAWKNRHEKSSIKELQNES